MDLDIITEVVLRSLDIYKECDFLLYILNNIASTINNIATHKVMNLTNRFIKRKIKQKLRNYSKCRGCQMSAMFPYTKNNYSFSQNIYMALQNKPLICQIGVEDIQSVQAETFMCKTLQINYTQDLVAADLKITKLETENDQLKKQILKLSFQLQQCTITPVSSNAVFIGSNVPPPPPPPLPPIIQTNAINIENIKHQIKVNKSRKSNSEFEDNYLARTSTPLLSLADIMKGAKNVKLRKIARSPGGTPIRPAKTTDSDTDLSTIMARALKRRFDKIHPIDSPDTGSENSFLASSPDCSFGKQRRRSKLLTLSPLREVNY